MVKLVVEILNRANEFQNTLHDRELDLRGNKIPQIENLGSTRDRFDTIDLTNNNLKKMDNFPLLPRLKTILLALNHIHRVDTGMGEFLPNLRCLVLGHNNLKELCDVAGLLELKGLRMLSLNGNAVCRKKHYRALFIHHLPQLRFLDFQKVRQAERDHAAKLFSGAAGDALIAKLLAVTSVSAADATAANSGTFAVGHLGAGGDVSADTQKKKLSKAEVARIKEAIKSATTLEEVGRLERLLRSGRMP